MHPTPPFPPLIVVMGVSGSGQDHRGRTRSPGGWGCPSPTPTTSTRESNVAKMAAGTPLDDEDRRPWLQIDRRLARRARRERRGDQLLRPQARLPRPAADRAPPGHLPAPARRPARSSPPASPPAPATSCPPRWSTHSWPRSSRCRPTRPGCGSTSTRRSSSSSTATCLPTLHPPRSRAPPRGPTSLEPSDMTSSLLALAPSALAAADAPAIPAGRLIPAALIGIALIVLLITQVQGPPLPRPDPRLAGRRPRSPACR